MQELGSRYDRWTLCSITGRVLSSFIDERHLRCASTIGFNPGVHTASPAAVTAHGWDAVTAVAVARPQSVETTNGLCRHRGARHARQVDGVKKMNGRWAGGEDVAFFQFKCGVAGRSPGYFGGRWMASDAEGVATTPIAMCGSSAQFSSAHSGIEFLHRRGLQPSKRIHVYVRPRTRTHVILDECVPFGYNGHRKRRPGHCQDPFRQTRDDNVARHLPGAVAAVDEDVCAGGVGRGVGQQIDVGAL